jgi:hypothetical protein
LVWLVRCATVVSADWVIRNLSLGHRSHVSRAVRALQEAPTATLVKLRRKLLACKQTQM